MQIRFTSESLDVEDWLLDFLVARYPEYHLEQLSNNLIPNIPSTNAVHPIIMEYQQMASGSGTDWESILPAVGVELVTDDDNLKKLGYSSKIITIDQAFMDSISFASETNPGQRMRLRTNSGIFLSNEQVDELQGLVDTLDVLYGKHFQWLEEQAVNISIWAESIEIRKILYMTTKAIILRAKNEIMNFANIRNMTLSANLGLYNTELARILFGSEMSLRYINSFNEIVADEDLSAIENIEETYPDNKLNAGIESTIGPKFVAK